MKISKVSTKLKRPFKCDLINERKIKGNKTIFRNEQIKQ